VFEKDFDIVNLNQKVFKHKAAHCMIQKYVKLRTCRLWGLYVYNGYLSIIFFTNPNISHLLFILIINISNISKLTVNAIL